MPRLIDLSHTVRDRMVTYPGLPGPEIGEHLSRADSSAHYAPGTRFQIGRIAMIANTGTYVDAPFHRYAQGADLASLPLESLAELDGAVVSATRRDGRAIGPEVFSGLALRGRAVLFHTGWSAHFATERYGRGHPYLSADAARGLVEGGARLVGIDSLNIDDDQDGRRPVHTALLAAGIPIVEHLRGLEQLPPEGFRFHAVPVKVAGLGSFPVRAYAVVDD